MAPALGLLLALVALSAPRASAQRLREYNLWVCPHCQAGVKVADVTDLGCEVAAPTPGGHDWPWIKRALRRFLSSLHPSSGSTRDAQEVKTLIDLAGAPLTGECYLGVMALGFFALQFMDPSERADFMRTSVFGGVPWKKAIPLSYWDVYASGWPLFGILAVSAGRVQQDAYLRPGEEASSTFPNVGLTGIDLGPRDCCDFPNGPPNDHDQKFLVALSGSLGHSAVEGITTGAPLPMRIPLEYLAQSAHRRCSWGRATAYVALVEGLLAGEGRDPAALEKESQPLMQLAEHNLDGCEPNVTVYHLMRSVWPFWQILGRLELRGLEVEVPPMHPGGPGEEAAQQTRLPPLRDVLRLKWKGLLRRRGLSEGQAAAEASSRGAAGSRSGSSPAVGASEVETCLGGVEDLTHVALSADRTQIDGFIVTLHSAVQNAALSSVARLCVHGFVLPEERGFVIAALQCAFGSALEALPLPGGGFPTASGEGCGSAFGPTAAFRVRGSAKLVLHCLNATRVWEEVGLLPSSPIAAAAAARLLGPGAEAGHSEGAAVDGGAGAGAAGGAGAGSAGSAGGAGGAGRLAEVDARAIASDTGNLRAVHNFARFVLHELLPGLPRVVYLDVDVVVKGDLAELYRAPLSLPGGDVGTIAAVRRSHQPLRIYVDVLHPSVPGWLPSEAQSFNAGVLVIDLVRWRERHATSLIAEWLAANARQRLWLHGSQPPLLLLFHDEVVPLEWVWNIDGLGHRLNYPKDILQQAKILHWTGPLKPWRHHGVNRMLWEPYALEYCPEFSFREHTTTCRPDSWFC